MPAEEYSRMFVGETMLAKYVWVVTSEYKGAERPLCWVTQAGNGRTYETHVNWMHWASPRDKVTAALTFIESLRDEQTMLITSFEKVARFHEQLGRYGVLRKIGIVKQFYPDGEDAIFWQSRGRK